MSDIGGGAVASSEGTSAPIEQVPQAPEPVHTDNQAPATEKPEKAEPAKQDTKPVSTRDALKKAAEAVNKREGDAAKPVKSDPKPDAAKTESPTRSEDGKFAAKQAQNSQEGGKPAEGAAEQPKPSSEPVKPTQRYEAPARFSAEAKTAWETAPDAVKAETHRALTELQQGYEKHREASDFYKTVEHFDRQARQQGSTLQSVLTEYTNAENLLRQNPIQGLEFVCQNLGLSLRQVAEHVMGQTPDQRAAQSDATIRDLNSKIAQLEKAVGGVTGHMQSQQLSAREREVEAFAAENPRFGDLAETISMLLAKGVTTDLSEAYSMAERLNPAPAPASAPAAPAAPPANDLTAQTLKGSKSITGSPSTGSDPAGTREPSSSTREALKRAFAQAG